MDLTTRKQIAESLKGREVRRATFHDFEMRRVGDVYKFDGLASVTDHAYSMGHYDETMRGGCFTGTLSQSPDVQLLVNHDGLPIARTGRNMVLTEERGLRVQADLNPALPRVEEVALTAGDGLIDQMSFAFRVLRQEWDDDYENREIIEVDIHRGDVSIVNQGANPATSFSLRDAHQMLTALSHDEFVEFMRSIRPEQSATDKPVDPFAAALDGVRAAGATDDQADALQNILNLIDASDTNVDKALIALSAFMGVTNPDVAQDEALDRSLEFYKARALALRLAAA